jgi:hypothetical protein
MNDDSATQTISYGRRAASYWSIDGLPEILRGLAFIVLTGMGYLWRVHASKPRAGFLFLGFAVYFFVVERVVLNYLKSRITYPRTGYVEPPERLWVGHRAQDLVPLSLRSAGPFLLSPFPPSGSENVTFFWPRTVRPLLVFVFLCTFGGNLLGRWLLPLAMPALAVTLHVVNRNSERPYPRWSVLFLALTGPPFLWINMPATLQLTLPFLLAGAWLVAQGAYRLFDYLRTNPYPRTTEGVKA